MQLIYSCMLVARIELAYHLTTYAGKDLFKFSFCTSLCQTQKTNKTQLVDGREMNINFPLYFFQRTDLPFVSCLHTPS